MNDQRRVPDRRHRRRGQCELIPECHYAELHQPVHLQKGAIKRIELHILRINNCCCHGDPIKLRCTVAGYSIQLSTNIKGKKIKSRADSSSTLADFPDTLRSQTLSGSSPRLLSRARVRQVRGRRETLSLGFLCTG